jgi:hypothetical protein
MLARPSAGYAMKQLAGAAPAQFRLLHHVEDIFVPATVAADIPDIRRWLACIVVVTEVVIFCRGLCV